VLSLWVRSILIFFFLWSYSTMRPKRLVFDQNQPAGTDRIPANPEGKQRVRSVSSARRNEFISAQQTHQLSSNIKALATPKRPNQSSQFHNVSPNNFRSRSATTSPNNASTEPSESLAPSDWGHWASGIAYTPPPPSSLPHPDFEEEVSASFTLERQPQTNEELTLLSMDLRTLLQIKCWSLASTRLFFSFFAPIFYFSSLLSFSFLLFSCLSCIVFLVFLFFQISFQIVVFLFSVSCLVIFLSVFLSSFRQFCLFQCCYRHLVFLERVGSAPICSESTSMLWG